MNRDVETLTRLFRVVDVGLTPSVERAANEDDGVTPDVAEDGRGHANVVRASQRVDKDRANLAVALTDQIFCGRQNNQIFDGVRGCFVDMDDRRRCCGASHGNQAGKLLRNEVDRRR